MDSKPTATETTTIRNLVVPEIQRSLRIPQEIIDEILDHLVADTDCDALYQDKSLSKLIRSCSLVSKLWVTPCQRHLFHTIDFNVEGMDKWIKAFRVPYRSPARYIRDLRLSVSGYLLPTEFLRRMQSFTNVKRISVLGNEPRIRFFRIPSFVGLPQSATSFSIEAKIVDLEQIRDVMKLLPNLDDLSLSGSIDVGPRASLRGLGAVLQARFGGRLRLRVLEGTDKYFVDMLLEVPTGLRFTEVDAYARPESHLSIVRLVEACSGTLVKLSYGCFTTTGKSYPFQHQTFTLTLVPPQGFLTSLSTFPSSQASKKCHLSISVGAAVILNGSLRPLRHSTPQPLHAYPKFISNSLAPRS